MTEGIQKQQAIELQAKYKSSLYVFYEIYGGYQGGTGRPNEVTHRTVLPKQDARAARQGRDSPNAKDDAEGGAARRHRQW